MSQDEIIKKELFNPEKEQSQEIIFEQYKLYVAMADKISERRQTANNFFLTINTAVVAMLGIGWNHIDDDARPICHVVVGIAGAILCYSWYRLLKSYRDLNSGKFRVIHAIENVLPLRLFDAEWTSVGRGEKPELYLPFTHIETKVPWVFFALYVFLIAIYLGKSCIGFYSCH